MFTEKGIRLKNAPGFVSENDAEAGQVSQVQHI